MLTPFGVGVLCSYGYLVVPSVSKHVPTFLLFIKLNGCHLLAKETFMFNLNLKSMEKEVLEVNQNVSKSLSAAQTLFKIFATIGLILGVILVIVGGVDNEGAAIATGVWLIVSAILTFGIALPLFKGFITIVKTAEYHNAQIESKYNIK